MRKANDPLVVVHRDRGCNLSPACLECHLPRCPEDRPYGKADMRMFSRAAEMSGLRSQGWLIREIAARFDVSDRTVYRSLSPLRPAAEGGRGGA